MKRQSNLLDIQWYVAFFSQSLSSEDPVRDAFSKIGEEATRIVPFGLLKELTFSEINDYFLETTGVSYSAVLIFTQEKDKKLLPFSPAAAFFYYPEDFNIDFYQDKSIEDVMKVLCRGNEDLFTEEFYPYFDDFLERYPKESEYGKTLEKNDDIVN